MKMLLVVVAAMLQSAVVAFTVRTPATKAYFDIYRKSITNVVDQGGWYAVEQQAMAQLANDNLSKLQLDLGDDADSPTIMELAADPKGILLHYIQQQLQNPQNDPPSPQVFNGLVRLLQAQGKGLDSDLLQGEWISVMTSSGPTGTPKLQRIGKNAQHLSYSNFNCKDGILSGNVKLIFGQGDLRSTVKFTPIADNFEKHQNKIILRRMACDITGASWKFWKLPRIPLPLWTRKNVGNFLDVLYLDEDVRVTKGNRGGTFVHVRPSLFNTMK